MGTGWGCGVGRERSSDKVGREATWGGTFEIRLEERGVACHAKSGGAGRHLLRPREKPVLKIPSGSSLVWPWQRQTQGAGWERRAGPAPSGPHRLRRELGFHLRVLESHRGG